MWQLTTDVLLNDNSARGIWRQSQQSHGRRLPGRTIDDDQPGRFKLPQSVSLYVPADTPLG